MSQFLTDLDTLKARGKMRIAYNNRFILLAWIDEKAYAIQDKCPHMGASLHPGRIDGEVVFCKDHNLGISLKTGEVVNQSQADHLRLDEYNRSVRTFPVIIKDGKVFLDK